MKNSEFFNPTGLPHDKQISTAEDVATLASLADEVSELRAIVSMPAHTVEHGDASTTFLKNTNRLLRTVASCDGMKTGFTRASGRCVVASGSFGELRRIVVVLNSVGEQVWSDARHLLNFSLGIVETTNGVAGASG
jgi:serine-type D-Ala-D-Ala carboxypeptidase (penicillin-binding protein 5/6)